MNSWSPDYAVLRQRQKELWQEAEERRLAGALRRSRKAIRTLQRSPVARRQPRPLGVLSLRVWVWNPRSDPSEKETHGWSD
ncbi:Hypothetical Protein RradSPS_2832 (plasmid) [Rubrobacter radiotolerans]|uniref:Uncharacterized protein n=1 Tax=Rubrobacter radiotolerans TaxID=42256 RepID=A0A023X7V2_RUBRA|nr:Hypothetical Protein RradSPS_2832 [Rubrobacter radiotolerans]SMC01746.1 hypothetical protein SAMN00767673_2939 [Rubrobacter radiotolerans DSM 5868]